MMTKLLEKLLVRLITPERILNLIASLIVKLLKWARKSDRWDSAKSIIDSINRYTGIFLEVYADDSLTESDEELIRAEIERLTDAKTLKEIAGKVLKK